MNTSLIEASRRKFLQLSALGVGSASMSGWLGTLASRAAAAPTAAGKKPKSCILLWMDGGPSHKETFDLKPGSKSPGEFKPIKTSAPGVEISEHLPQLAKHMHHGVVVRSMNTPEGAHARAKYHLHTGYREGQGGLVYPSIGAISGYELGKADAAMPNFVSIGGRSFGAGFLGPKAQPLIVQDASKGVEDLKAAVSEKQFGNRTGLLEQMEKSFYGDYKAEQAIDHKTTLERAVKLMQSKEAKAFDISAEPAASKSKYGSDKFGEGVVMARRLVEVGVPFIEVTLGGWDMHQDLFDKAKSNLAKVDAAMSALLSDLKERGLLDSTLVIWMGEFGRTPNMNTRGAKPGRDHYPKAWSLAMFGGGLKGGQVYGATDKEGATVAEKPVKTGDFLATVCEVLGIDHTKDNTAPGNRPIKIVDKGNNPFTKAIM
jgi:hypothetical protein